MCSGSPSSSSVFINPLHKGLSQRFILLWWLGAVESIIFWKRFWFHFFILILTSLEIVSILLELADFPPLFSLIVFSQTFPLFPLIPFFSYYFWLLYIQNCKYIVRITWLSSFVFIYSSLTNLFTFFPFGLCSKAFYLTPAHIINHAVMLHLFVSCTTAAPFTCFSSPPLVHITCLSTKLYTQSPCSPVQRFNRR